ncbi:MAG: hypothetical protein H6825_12555, partial [Planctomycetes bacterium]|nr:hypothetical protein [Planctomycetota bacterium]
MRILLLVVACVVLLLVGALLAVDRHAPELVREGLVRLGFDDLVAFDEVHADPLDDRVVVRGGRLIDPSGGQIVAQVDTLTVDLPPGWREGELPMPVALHGRGGRAVLRWDAAGEQLTVVDVLVDLVERILAMLPPGDEHHPLLPMTFDDLDLVVHAPNHPLERLSGVSVSIRERNAVVIVLIQPGPGQGEVELAFDHDGFRRFEAHGMRATPTLLGIVPEVGWFLADGLAPHGVVDVEVTHTDELLVRGRVHDASFASPYVPFPLGPADASFEVVGDRLRVDEAAVGFEGGSVRVSMLGPIDDLDVRLDVAHAAFREELLGLVPAYARIERIRCHDGGTFELGLSLHADLTDPEAPLSIDGQGGFHIEAVDVTAMSEQPLHLTDVVGRFRVDDEGLVLPDVSARLARGSVRGSGDVSVVT